MKTHRIDEKGFLDTVTPDEYDDFAESARAAFDAEFDAERGSPGFAIAMVLIVAGALMGAIWYGVAELVQMFGSKP